MLFLIKPDAATHHAQFVLLIYYLLTTKLGATREIAADAPVSRHRDMYQTEEDWLATLRAAIRKVMLYPYQHSLWIE